MSIVYFIACDKKLTKTKFFYSYIKGCRDVLTENDGIAFIDNLTEEEAEIANNLFQQRIVYEVAATVPLHYGVSDKEVLGEQYYITSKNQMQWFIGFLKKLIKINGEVFFLRTSLGHSIPYNKILSKYIDINNFVLPEENFDFEPNLIYQFVDNS